VRVISPRARLVLVVIAALALPATLFAAFAGRASESDGPAAVVEEIDSSGAKAPASPFEGAMRPKTPRADFALRDQDGDLVQLSRLRGKVVVLTPLYTHCEDTCPLTAQQIRGALDDLGRDVPVLAISVDPKGDTRLHVKRFLIEQHLSGRMRYLVGTRAQLEPVWRAYGIQPQGRGFEHTASTVIVDGAGRQRVGYLTDQLTPEALADDLRALAGDARAAR
jgi:protein SCO1/2